MSSTCSAQDESTLTLNIGRQALLDEIARLRVDNARLSASVADANIGVWDWADVGSDDVYWSDRFLGLIGYEPGELETKISVFRALLHPDDAQATFDQLDAHLTAGTVSRQEFRMRCKSGEYRWFASQGTTTRDALGKAVRMVGSIQDITRQRRIETELRQSNVDLAQFAYVASHDLKTPLRGIGTTLNWLEDDFGDNNLVDIPNHIGAMRERVARLEAMIDGLLQYAQADKVYSAERTSLARVIEAVQQDIVKTYPGFELRAAGLLPDLQASPVLIRQVIGNLVDNAIKHHDRGAGLIRVEVCKRYEFLEIAICDDGPGIPPEYRERIFDVFQTLESRDDGGGSGIGLAIVRKVVCRHGGNIAVLPNRPRGSRFVFTWPMATEQTDAVL